MKRMLILFICVIMALCGAAYATEPLKVSIEANVQGRIVELTAIPVGGTPPYEYQWYKNGEVMVDENGTAIADFLEINNKMTYKVTLEDDADDTASAQTSVLIRSMNYNVNPSEWDFGERIEGYQNPPDAKTVTVKNINTNGESMKFSLSTLDDSSGFVITKLGDWDSSVGPNGALEFSVQPKANLQRDKYETKITVTATIGEGAEKREESSETVNLLFWVKQQPKYHRIALSPTSVTFPSVREGYATPPPAQTVTLKNTGNLIINPREIADSEFFDIVLPDAWAGDVYVGGERAFTVRLKLGLKEGEYKDSITVTTGQAVSASVDASVTVREAAVYDISLTPATDAVFPDAAETYDEVERYSVTLKNIGNEPTGKLNIALSGKNADAFKLSKATVESLAVGKEAIFSVEPILGLKIGNYAATVTVSGAVGIKKSFDVSFNVVQPWVDLKFTVEPAAYTAIELSNATKDDKLTVNAVAVPESDIKYEWYLCDIGGRITDETVLGREKIFEIKIPNAAVIGETKMFYYLCRASCLGAREVYSQVAAVDARLKTSALDSISMIEKREMMVGESEYLAVQITPATIDRGDLRWTSSDDSVAEVDYRSGLVTAKRAGTATITVEFTHNSRKKTTSCEVTVVRRVTASEIVRLRTVHIDAKQKVDLSKVFGDKYYWESLDRNTAYISKEYTLTGKRAGTTTVRGTLGAPQAKTALIGDVIELKVVVGEKGSSVKKLTLSPKKPNIKRGESITMKAALSPKDAVDKTVIWSVSDEDVAAVDETGTVTGLRPGKAVVTAIASSGVKATANVTVSAEGTNADKPLAQSLFISPDVRTQRVGEEIRLDLAVTPANANQTGLTWETSDASVATVDSTGAVTAVSEGETAITARLGELSATCRLTVKSERKSESIPTIVIKDITLKKGDKLDLNGINDINVKGRWTSSRSGIASVTKKGVLTAKKEGTATVTFSAGVNSEEQSKSLVAGDTVSLNVTVVKELKSDPKPVFDAKYNKNKILYIVPGEKLKVDLAIVVAGAYWKSGDRSIFTVDDAGVITGVAPGAAKVYVFSSSGKSDKMTITVTRTVREFALDKGELKIKVGGMVNLGVKSWSPASLPAPAIVKWSSNKTGIATVDKNGKVKGIRVGTATITAVSESGAKATCKVTITY